jgi:hypothetical protein
MVGTGLRPAAEAAQCVEERGKFMPQPEFSHDGQDGTLTHRLRVADLWFDKVPGLLTFTR